jgi:hypothetical protein
MIYVIDRDQMGKFHPDGDAIVQEIKMRGGGYGAIAYWNGHAFFAASDDYLNDYAIQNAQLNQTTSREENLRIMAPRLPYPLTVSRTRSCVATSLERLRLRRHRN